jgi:heptosyltransferase-1
VKILILKPSSLGDVIHALPVLRMLKKHRPEARVYWWVDSGLAPLLADDPDVDGLIRFDRKRWSKPTHWNELAKSVRGVRAHGFDLTIDLQGLARSGLFAWFANAGTTIGLGEAREGSRAAYDWWARPPENSQHAVDRYLQVLEFLRVPVDWDFEWLPKREGAASAIAKKLGASSGRWVALQPGARWLNKRWPIEHFCELATGLLANNPSAGILVLGGAEDSELGKAIAGSAGSRCQDLTGKLTLPEMVEALRASELLITNDTGPMHVAAALGKPVVALFGPTNPERTGPYRQRRSVLQNADLPCVPCMISRCRYPKPLECLRSISVDAVLQEVNARHLAGAYESEPLATVKFGI